ncbi:MAG: hypothetical protein AAGI48_00620 [Verrucomicrobiota bacterium]
MKALLLIVIIGHHAASSSIAADESKEDKVDQLLREGATAIHYIWTEWMGKPSLKYTKITEENLKSLYGNWSGSYSKDDEEIAFIVSLSPRGKWTCEAFRPDMKNGHWYLSDGMLLLFESKIYDDANLASALTLNDGKLRLLNADTEAGFVELTKAE